MLVMRTTKDPTDPIRKLISSQKIVRFHDLALAMNPFGLDGVEPRTLLRKKAAHDPHSSFAATLLDLSVVSSEPAPDLPGDMPARALSQMRSKTFLPISSSFWQHHSRNWVVMELM